MADEEQTLEIVSCKKSRDEARIFSLGIPIENVLAVRHESEGHKRLPFTSGDLVEIDSQLLLALSWMSRRLLRFDDGEDLARWMEQAIVGDAVPGLFVIAIDGNFKINLRAILEIPTGCC